MVAALNRRLLCCLLLLASCRSVDWQQGPEQPWRHLQCHRGPLAVVAARDEAAASDAYFDVERLCDVMQRAGIPAGRPLVLATSREDPFLFDEAQPTLEKLVNLHAQAMGQEPVPMQMQSDMPDIPGLVELMARALSAAIPLDSHELDVPDSWREGVEWMVVLPTNACSDAMANEILDVGLAKQELSFGEKLLLAPLMPFVRSAARSEVRRQVLERVFEAALASARRRGPVSDEAMAKARLELGLRPSWSPVVGMQQ